jgi:four helix bundle protein
MVLEKAFGFSVEIVNFCCDLPKDSAGIAISSQLVRSATSIGANIEEAQDAMSRADFLKCMNIALKEARESRYWLKIISESKLTVGKKVSDLVGGADQLVRMLTKIVKTTKERNKII